MQVDATFFKIFSEHHQLWVFIHLIKALKMSLNIPGAPNAGLFKQGYQKYALLYLGCKEDHLLTCSLVTNLKMELLSGILMLAVRSPQLSRHPWGHMGVIRLSLTICKK